MWAPTFGQPQLAGAGFFVALVGFIAYGVRRLLGRSIDSAASESSADSSDLDRGQDEDAAR